MSEWFTGCAALSRFSLLVDFVLSRHLWFVDLVLGFIFLGVLDSYGEQRCGCGVRVLETCSVSSLQCPYTTMTSIPLFSRISP